MKVLIAGSRGWHDPAPLNALLAGLDVLAEGAGQKLTIIHGDARSGADLLADTLGRQWGAKVVREPADWDVYGKAAGPIRNQRMIDNHRPDVVYAFRASGKSNGTDDLVKRAQRAGIPTYVVAANTRKDHQ